MSETANLENRIDAEFAEIEAKASRFRAEQAEEYKQRQQRLAQLEGVFDELRSIWRPRLETLAAKFGAKAKVTPSIKPANRQAVFDFRSDLASVHLKFAATADADVRNVMLSYDLQIIPVLMQFEPHAELKVPLGAVDKAAVAKWMDDRIVDFVRTYLAMSQNNYYLKDHLVEDPVAHVRFPNFAAACTLEHNGVTQYFISDETRQEFARQKGISPN